MSITEPDHSPTTAQRGAGRRRRRRWIAVLITAAVVVALAWWLGAAWQLGNSAAPASPAWRPVQGHGRFSADWVGVWVDSLPSGPVAQAAWVDGGTLHEASHTVPITGPGIGAYSGPVVTAATRIGWLVTFATPTAERLGVIHPDGTLVEFQKYAKAGPPLVSPNGRQALVGGDGRGEVITTATGRVIGREPLLLAIAWGKRGIYAETGRHGQRLVVWKPGVGITRSSFDAQGCDSTGTITANLLAGHRGCTVPLLASVSPDGTHALVGNDAVDLRTGRKIRFAPQNPFQPFAVIPSYAVMWEDNEHALIELTTPTVRATSTRPKNSHFAIVRCNVTTGSCERASDPINASGIGLAPLL